MSYSDFTIGKCKKELGVSINEGATFFPHLEALSASSYLHDALEFGLPIARAKSSEKARSELLITPVLLEVRQRLDRKISLFSGEEFNVDPAQGLNGICDFLISRSPEQLEIEAPAIFIVEAKKSDLYSGLGQCVAEMVAAQQFNRAQGVPINPVYGCVSSGILWQFLQLTLNADQRLILDLDLAEYTITPVEALLARLCWMCGYEASPLR